MSKIHSVWVLWDEEARELVSIRSTHAAAETELIERGDNPRWYDVKEYIVDEGWSDE